MHNTRLSIGIPINEMPPSTCKTIPAKPSTVNKFYLWKKKHLPFKFQTVYFTRMSSDDSFLIDTSQPRRFLLQISSVLVEPMQVASWWLWHNKGRSEWPFPSAGLPQLLCFYNKSKRITPTQHFLSCCLGPIMTATGTGYSGLETTSPDRLLSGLGIIQETRNLRGHLQRYLKHSSCSQLSAFSPPRLQQSKREVSWLCMAKTSQKPNFLAQVSVFVVQVKLLKQFLRDTRRWN